MTAKLCIGTDLTMKSWSQRFCEQNKMKTIGKISPAGKLLTSPINGPGERKFRTDGLVKNGSSSSHSKSKRLCVHTEEKGWSELFCGKRLLGQFVTYMGIRVAVSTRCRKDRLGTTTGWVLGGVTQSALGRRRWNVTVN